ncbi:cubilin-like [Branchiostoma floridae]|uniref:Cubilin-like n=1 Tax=Branchiostoma floridae TaxID=7739 RepID=A0A9J7L6H5_BRAFL|nr:cubilin-like [Branchiostoma floridae]
MTGRAQEHVSSPNYPGQYGNNLHCTWTIEVNEGELVGMTPVSFSLEEGYDWLDVWEGELDQPTWLGSYTGHVRVYIAGQSSGFVSFNYTGQDDNSLQRAWTIEVNEGEGIKLTTQSFSLSDGYNWLDVYKEELDIPVLLGLYTGRYIPAEFYVPVNTVHLVLSTSYNNTDDGFKIHFEGPAHACVAAGGRYLYEKEGEILPPRDEVTGTYQTNVDCSWTIVAHPGKVVVVEFLEFDIEYEARCRYDFLQIHDTPYWEFYQTFCGVSLPPVYVSMAPDLAIHFHSDESTTGTGFKIRYYLQEKSEDDRQGYQRMHQLSEDTGTFSSMNYPHYSYRNHVYQQWYITMETHKAVKLSFLHFDLDIDPEGLCRRDYVEVEDPYEQKNFVWCGSCAHSGFTSAEHSLYVFFVTDFVIRRAGFSARYEAVDKRLGTPTQDDRVARSNWLLVSDRIKQISVSTTTNQVWALDDEGRPLRRTGITKTTPQALQLFGASSTHYEYKHLVLVTFKKLFELHGGAPLVEDKYSSREGLNQQLYAL